MIKRYILTILILILFVGSSITAAYFYFQWKKAVTAPSAEEEIAEVIGVIGTYMELPEGETPTIATVLDKEKLADQAFFNNSENGDKVLIYTTAKKAILYRPSTKKVIEVAPIYFDDTQQQTGTQQPATEQPATPPPTDSPTNPTTELTP